MDDINIKDESNMAHAAHSDEMFVSEGTTNTGEKEEAEEDTSPPTSTATAGDAYISPSSSEENDQNGEEKPNESEVNEPTSTTPSPSSSDQRGQEGSNTSSNAAVPPEETAGVTDAKYVSLSASPSKDGSTSTNTSNSSLLKDFLENFLSQETEQPSSEQQGDAANAPTMPADSMHIRGDGQVEISQHDDAGNLFALEAGNRSVVDIHHANDGHDYEGEGRASAASLCVIEGEQDDISVLTEAVLLELPASESDTENNEWVTFDDEERVEMARSKEGTISTARTSTPSSDFSGTDATRENRPHPVCVDLCGIDCLATSTRLGEWMEEKRNEYNNIIPPGLNRVIHAVSLWYQRLINPSLRSKSSNGDAMKRLADAKKTERMAMRESQSIFINTTIEEEAPVPESIQEKSPGDIVAAEQHITGETHEESRDDIVEGTLQQESPPIDDTEEREGEEGNEHTAIASPNHRSPPKAPVSILKKGNYQPKVIPIVTTGSESKKKAKKTPKSSTTPRRTPKSTKQYIDTSKKSFWASKSPKAVPILSLKGQKGWTSSNSAPSDYATMI